MKRWGQDALAYPKPITLIKCKWAKKTHNTPLFYIMCCAQLIMASHIREPIKHTCPDIDRYIKTIKQVLYKDRELKGLEYDDLFSAAVDMSYELESCIDYLEELRASNDELRQWGIEEADKADDFELKIEELENEGAF